MNRHHDNPTSIRNCARAAIARAAGAAALLLAATGAHATMKCVATVDGGLDGHDDGLTASIAAANIANEGTTWDIRLRPGIYQLDGDLKFQPDDSKDNKKFSISGGWDATCQGPNSGVAHDTVIRGVAGYSQIWFRGDNASLSIKNLRFEKFYGIFIDDKYCQALNICPDTDSVTVEGNEFASGGSVSIDIYDAKKLIFRNNLVVGTLARLSNHNSEDPPQITFNTFTGASCGPGDDSAVQLFSTNSQMALHHNIFDSNCATDLAIDNGSHDLDFVAQFQGQSLTPYYNLWATIDGGVNGDVFANQNIVSTNPKFKDPANGDFRLQDTSPAVNKGAGFIDALLGGFIAPDQDLDHKARPVGDHLDIGAYESNVYDNAPAIITVNSANDVDDGTCNGTHCSLREAINLANTQDNIAQRIAFDIPGSCPRVIMIDSPLPDVTDSLTIDGYTQPGANANALDFGSDANICIGVTPGAIGVSYALQVPAGEPDATRLTVRGLAFGSSLLGFGTSAIALRAGSGHRIVGNAFGGFLPPSHNTESIGSLPRSILVRGTAKNVHIGSAAAADRNTIGSNNENAIVLNDATSTGHFIENNYIGLQPDGLTAQPNAGDGISASGGSLVTIDGNTIVASDYGIALLGATTTKFLLTNNRIGVNALYIANPTLSNTVGIAIGIGSGGHVIGYDALAFTGAGSFSNYIVNNGGDGVLVDDDAGATNTIRGNLIRDNGQGGVGIGIDLGGSQAPLANDDADPDAGPNALQNHPVIYGSNPSDATHRAVKVALNTVPNQKVRVDVYHANSCKSDLGADANYLVGSADATTNASGIAQFTIATAEGGKSGYLTATATTTSGKTSELATCVPEDRIFADGAQKVGL